MDDLGVSTIQIRDNRYDAVIHLVTAADGAESFYATLTGEARYETIDEAKVTHFTRGGPWLPGDWSHINALEKWHKVP